MAMVGLERWFMGSPLKKIMQRFFEFRLFSHFIRSQQIPLHKGRILEIGCGNGYGLKLISKKYRPYELVGIDIDPTLVGQAQRNCPEARVQVADVTNLSEQSNQFDAVLAFTVFHHIPSWKKALQEVHRVLKKPGLFIVNELNKRTIDWLEWIFKIPHPPEARFAWDEFTASLQRIGFTVTCQVQFFGAMGFFLCEKM